MTKTGYIGFLEPGSIIECRTKEGKIKIVVKNIVVNPDDMGILIYFDHHIGKTIKRNSSINLRDLQRWFDEAKWKAVKVRR